MNRFIEWGCDGIAIEADQRHSREMLKDLELERANHSATPCAVKRKSEGNARSDESKGENRCGQGQTQTEHEWDGMGDGDGDMPQQVVTRGAVTRPTSSQGRVNAGMLCHDKTVSA